MADSLPVRNTEMLDHRSALAEESDLEAFVGYNLKRAYMIVQADFRAAQGADGLSARAFSALSMVVQFPKITQSELARSLGIERSGLVAVIDDLEARGFVSRAPVSGDRRVQALVPSPSGSAAYAAALDTVRAHERALLSHLSEDEKGILLGLLRKIRAREESI